MAESNISVGIPVGPRPGHRRWLEEAIASCHHQTLLPDEIILVTESLEACTKYNFLDRVPVRVWAAPWRLGSANAFNQCVGLARTEYIFLLGSDDTLEPTCLAKCMATLGCARDPLRTVVWTGVRYMEDGRVQTLPCGAMMVSKSLWRFVGGYPLEAAVGAPDFLLLSALQGPRGKEAGIEFIGVEEPLYNYRTHPDTENEQRKLWWPVIEQIHGIFDQTWRPL